MARENVENQLRAIDDAAFGQLFDVALLHGGKIAVENDQLRLVGIGFSANLVQLAAAYQRGGVCGIAHLENRGDNGGASAAGEFHQFEQGFAALFARGHSGEAGCTLPADADEQGAFGVGNLLWRFGQRTYLGSER